MLPTTGSHLFLKVGAVIVLLWLTIRTLRSNLQFPYIESHEPAPRPIIAKVSVLYGEENQYYERAIITHDQHAKLHNYPQYVLRRAIADGYWNKEFYLLSIVIQELSKPVGERVEWLMWFDADSLIINPEIPVDVFFPPTDLGDYHVLATKDQNGLNSGIFFLRVHQWSVQMLLRALGTPIFRPDIDLGFSADQKAMAMIFNETENKGHVLYQPRPWYNTYEFSHAYEGKEGDMLVHFPGMYDERDQHMRDWLEVLDGPNAQRWRMPFEQTAYPEKLREFWKLIRSGRLRLDESTALLAQHGETDEAVAVVEHLRGVMYDETDQIATMKEAIEMFDRMFYSTASAHPDAQQFDQR